ncbi:MAG: hypothetical protein LBM98_01890 [Oscillospiraceae bacterium]|nr:hypothetical protein [Oscillospiraceae bacterium]
MYRTILRQTWIASPHIINYVSQVRRRLRKDGQGEALPCPGAERRDGGRGYVRARRGETTPALRATPPKRGIYGGGFRNTATPVQSATLVQTYSPLGRGAARRRRGGFPRRTQPRPTPPSLIFDI